MFSYVLIKYNRKGTKSYKFDKVSHAIDFMSSEDDFSKWKITKVSIAGNRTRVFPTNLSQLRKVLS